LDNVKVYISGMMKELDWHKIEKRFERAERTAKVFSSQG